MVYNRMTDTAIVIVGGFTPVFVFMMCMACIYYLRLYDVRLFTRHEGLHTQEAVQPREEI
jgi:hypothetical protein